MADVTLTSEENIAMANVIIHNRSAKVINNGLEEENDNRRIQLPYNRNEWKNHPVIQRKLDRINQKMSTYIGTGTHSLSEMLILLSTAGCGTQAIHSDYQINQEINRHTVIPYIMLLPLSPGYLLYYQYILYVYRRNLFLKITGDAVWVF